ncbi:MAG: chloride channel protein [Actinomycetota bacterium]|jgi:CIC family chloride channel protein|nr:chloride channel protein [Actinomycetota bacterium]
MKTERSAPKMPQPTDLMKDAFESVLAQARYLKNLNELYKWSILSGMVGLLAGLGAILFTFIFGATESLFDSVITAMPNDRLIAVLPALGGIIVGIIRYRWDPSGLESASSMDTMIDAIHVSDGRIPVKIPFLTAITSSITLASGGSAGREGPAALIGAGFGSIVARTVERLHLDKHMRFSITKQDLRTLTICGTAAGLGAVFRAPIGSAMFAVSVIFMYGMEYDLMMPTLIASLTSYLSYSAIFGFEPLFNAPFAWEMNTFDVAVMVVIGLLCSLAGLAYIKIFYRIFRWFKALSIPNWLKPALGGVLVGVIVLFVPRIWGMGHQTIQDAIDLKLGAGLLVVLVISKMVASSFTIGSGGSGGDLTPSLFIGAALGGAVALFVSTAFPDAPSHPTLYVIAGMGSLYASIGKVPLASAILLCETTRNFTMIVPLIIANTAAFMASGTHTMYESQHADATREQADILSRVPVDLVQVTDPVVARADMSVIELLRLVGRTRHHGFPVLDVDDKLVGVISWKDAQNVPYQEREERTVGEAMTSPAITIKPFESARRALSLIETHHIGRVVVVDVIMPDKVLGIVTKEDLIQAYASRLQNDRSA